MGDDRSAAFPSANRSHSSAPVAACSTRGSSKQPAESATECGQDSEEQDGEVQRVSDAEKRKDGADEGGESEEGDKHGFDSR